METITIMIIIFVSEFKLKYSSCITLCTSQLQVNGQL